MRCTLGRTRRFNLWRSDKLGSPLACAVMRHAWSHMYVRFAKVDLCDQEFCPIAATLDTLHAVRRALTRRAVRIQRMHAARLHTRKPHSIPQKDAEKYDALIGVAVDGKYELTNVLPDAIAKHEATLKARIAQRQANKKTRRGKRPKHGQQP